MTLRAAAMTAFGSLVAIDLERQQDVVLARRTVRQAARLLGFDDQDQSRIATAVSEVARNALQHGGGGVLAVAVEGEGGTSSLVVRVSDEGPGIADFDAVLSGRANGGAGIALGLVGARRLMDAVEFDSVAGRGTTVTLRKALTRPVPPIDESVRARLAAELRRDAVPDAFSELHSQNRELARSLAALRERHEELERLNRELADTNRGVVALYAELDEKAETLRHADLAKSRFLSNLSHELRTPLGSIRSLARLLLDRTDGPLTAEQERQVGYIRRAAEVLGELVDDLLDIAKIEAGKIELHAAPVDLPMLWSALRGMMRPLLGNPAVSLVFEDPPAATLVSDEGKIAQILRNLVANALKYTEQGEVRVRAALDADRVVFEVSDTGIGIAPEHHESIFEEFVQIDSPLQRRHRGTGLGLPLCRRLATLLGGTIEVRSQPGLGSSFTVTLPGVGAVSALEAQSSAQTAGEAASASPARPRLAGFKRKLLIIDDDELMRYTLRKGLQDHFTVYEAVDGEEGLSMARRLSPDAIVLDVVMPKLSGPQVLERLQPARCRVIVLTGQPLQPAIVAGLESLGATTMIKTERAAEQILEALSPET